jgi:hypothetical protein
MFTRYAFLWIASVFFFAPPCHAGRVYQLIDYPANQNGHILKGTITTTDDASADSLLNVAEILSWQWSISGANTFAASSTEFLNETSVATGVQITTEAIALPIANFSAPGPFTLALARQSPGGRGGAYGHSLSWTSVNTPAAGTRNISSAARQRDDAFLSFWFGPATFASSSARVIAVAVPEPATGLLLTACTLMWTMRRHRHRLRIPTSKRP